MVNAFRQWLTLTIKRKIRVRENKRVDRITSNGNIFFRNKDNQWRTLYATLVAPNAMNSIDFSTKE